MFRIGRWAAVVSLLAGLPSCGPSKEAPEVVPGVELEEAGPKSEGESPAITKPERRIETH